MRITRRGLLSAATGAAIASALPGRAGAQPLAGVARIVCGFPAGGTADVTSRRLADAWRGKLAESVIVENRVGAGGRLAVGIVKDAAPDGRTLLLSPDSMLTIYQSVYRRLGYDPAVDVVPVSSVCAYTFAFGVGPGVPETVRTLPDFVAWLKANPSRTQYASPAAGSMPHFLGDVFYRAAGVTPNHVPYRGSAPAIQDLVGGHVPACMTVIGDFLPHRTQPGLRMLAVTNTARSRFMPDVPTFAEQGYGTVVGVETYGIFLPKQTATGLIEGVNRLIHEAVREPAIIGGLAQIGMDPAPVTPQAYAAQLERERTAWRPVVAASGFTLDE